MMNTWVVVADSSRARFLTMESRSQPLKELADMVHTQSRLHEGEVLSDREGNISRGHGNGGYSFEAPTDLKEHELETFARQIAHKLEEGRVSGTYQKLILVAPPSLLGKVRQTVNHHVLEMISHSLDKNLVAEDADEILKRINQVD